VERRNRLQITAEILRIAKIGAKKTHIVFKANLNHALLESYLKTLEGQGLVERTGPRNLIRTTEKGLQFVKQFANLQAFAGL